MLGIRSGRPRAAHALTIVSILFASSPVLAQENDDPWMGSWVSADVAMYVLTSDDDSYQGYFLVASGLLPFTARTYWGVGLRGSYTVSGAATNFEAVRAGSRLVLADPNSRVVLTRSEEPIPTEVVAALQAGSGSGAATEVATTAAGPAPHGPNAPAVEPAGGPGSSNPIVPAAASDAEFGDPYTGFRFSSIAGWVGSKSGEGYAFQSAEVPGSILVLPHDRRTLEELRADAQAGLVEGSVRLSLDGALESHGARGLSARIGGTIEGQSVKGRLITLLSPHGGGLTLIAVARDVDFGPAHESAAEALADGMEFFPPRAPDVGYEWRERLTGARLTYLYSYYSGGGSAYVGASEETTIDLCTEGHFYYNSNDSFSADGGGGVSGYNGSAARGAGAWSVESAAAPMLVLTFHDGRRYEYTLELDDEGKTLLDGQRYFRTYADAALAEARPACP